MTYIATAFIGAGVSIVYTEGQDISWFLEQAKAKNVGVWIEELKGCEG